MSEQSFKRIDPAAIPALFQKHGMRPRQAVFIEQWPERNTCCCVNTILAVDGGDRDVAVQTAEQANGYVGAADFCPLSGLSRDYAIALAFGWDDFMESLHLNSDNPETAAGYADGRAAWEACQSLLKEVAS